MMKLLSLILLFASTIFAQTIPHTEAETLSGKKIVLPDVAAGHPSIYMIGFSRAGGDSSGRWDKELRRELAGNSDLRFINVAVLQDAPKLARGVIKHGMRGGIPKNEHDTFVLLYQDEDTWKEVVGFADGNDAYVVLVDSAAKVVWHTQGKAPDSQVVDTLKSELAKLQLRR